MIEKRRGSGCSRATARRLSFVFFILGVAPKSVAERDCCVGLVENSKECGGDYSGHRYIVSSPNYPEAYPEKQSCVYRLRGRPLAKCSERLKVDFSLPPSEDCLEDKPEIGGESPLCGRLAGIRTYSSGERGLVVARLSSGGGRGGRGGRGRREEAAIEARRFKILVTALPCTPAQINEKERRDESSAWLSTTTTTRARIANDSRIASYLFVPAAVSERRSASIGESKLASGAPPARVILPPSREKTIFREASSLVTVKNMDAPPRAAIENKKKDKFFRVGGCRRDEPAPLDQFSSHRGESEGKIVPLDEVLAGSLDRRLQNNLPNLQVSANFWQRLPPPASIVDHSGNEFGYAGVPPGPAPRRPVGREDEPSNIFSPINVEPRGAPPASRFDSNGKNGPRLCCNAYFSGLRFFIASPGFPSVGHDAPYECAYSIIPYSLGICRMRFVMKYFNHGTEDGGSCRNGYLEIDGRRLCGCKTGSSVVSIVTSAFPKIIPVGYVGYPRSRFSGFFIEVVQESCSNSPHLGEVSRRKKDLGNWTNGDSDFTATARGKNLSSPRPERNFLYGYPRPNIGLTESPGLRNEASAGRPLPLLLACQALNFIDWTIAAKEAYLRKARCARTNPFTPDYRANDWIVEAAFREYPANRVTPVSPAPKLPPARCEDVNVSEGIVSSPGYPNEYPDNLGKCFRFHKAPESCQFELAIIDFDLENSAGCTKDYVTFGERNGRYCGRSLAGTKTLFDISGGNDIPKVCFVSDAFGSGRGFSLGFSQIPCR